MVTVRGKVLRRIQITPAWKAFVKQYAKKEGMQLREIVGRAIEWWLAERRNERVSYLAAHGKTEGWSMWLPLELARKVAEMSNEDETNDSSVIYTALVLYCEMVLKGSTSAEVLGIADYTASYQRPSKVARASRLAKVD